ncbi:MAG: hypothetical protein ABJB05_05555 [Parafilimonas sp.]
MKFFFTILSAIFLTALITGCQKSFYTNASNGTAGTTGTDSSGNTGSGMFDSTALDSVISAGDILTYEVIT